MDRNPKLAAEMHCDKHVVKMIVEYAQELSTAHRVLDGVPTIVNNGVRAKSMLLLEGETLVLFEGKFVIRNERCYGNTHAQHPSAIWARTSSENYQWLVDLFEGCLDEYTMRYGKIHATNKLREFFRTAPKNIPQGPLTRFAMAMPVQYKVNDEVLAYQNYYVGDKTRFARWTNRQPPAWFLSRVDLDESHFSRTR